MEYQITKSYLVFPVSRNASDKRIVFRKNGECVFSIDLALDFVTPERDVYVDVKRFSGDVLDVSVCPGMKLELKQKDSKPACKFRERLRPKFHFTSPEGYLGEPCAVVLQNGLYHMFYSVNPVGTQSKNATWAHAVSTNLLDWDYRAIALFPDKNGEVLPGSAIIDTKDFLGVKSDSSRNAMVLFYTAKNDGKNSTQCTAISNDGGITFIKLPSNPVVPFLQKGNRHPFVCYSESLKLFVMCLYTDADKYLILTSDNLLSFEKKQELNLSGIGENPVFFPMKNGNEEKWALIGGNDRYTVGTFDGKNFVPDIDGTLNLDYSENKNRDGKIIEGVSSGSILRFTRMNTDFEKYGMAFSGAMTVVQNLRLVDTPQGTRLSVFPAPEIERLRGRKTKERLECTDFSDELFGVARDIVLSLNPKDASFAKISLFGENFELDFVAGTVKCRNAVAPLNQNSDGRIDIRILTDICGMEIYLSGGLSYFINNNVPDMNLSTFVFSSDRSVDLKYESYKMRDSRKSDKRR